MRAVVSPLRSGKGRAAALALVALTMGTALYVSRLDAIPIQPGNEAMYAFPPLRMLRTEDYLVPYYEHGPFLEKPPLTWWILAGSYKLFGTTIFAARLPGAMAALVTILVVAVWARRRAGAGGSSGCRRSSSCRGRRCRPCGGVRGGSRW